MPVQVRPRAPFYYIVTIIGTPEGVLFFIGGNKMKKKIIVAILLVIVLVFGVIKTAISDTPTDLDLTNPSTITDPPSDTDPPQETDPPIETDPPVDTDPPITDPPITTDPPEPESTTITVTKVLKGEIWQVRCDVMDQVTFTAGGGKWKPDITNWEHVTSKEGHRSNHCGNGENWVLFVNEAGVATGLYQLKSGSTGGTLPSIMYRAPSDLANIPESQLIYDPTVPGDNMTSRLLQVFSPNNVMPFSEIPLEEGQRLFWISQNGNQVWHHTGILRRTYPRFAIVINGEPYSLGVGETITISDVEEGLVQVEEIATANYKLQAVQNDGEGNYVIINEIDDPGRPSPTPPPQPTTPTPTPADFTPTPSPSPTPTPSPSPTPAQTSIVGYKVWDDQSNSAGQRPQYIIINLYGNNVLVTSIEVRATGKEENESVWEYSFEGLPVYDLEGKEIEYTITEEKVDGYEIHYRGLNVFNVYITPTPSPTPSPTPTPTPSLTPSAIPSPTPTPTITPTVSPTDSPTPSPQPTESPRETETPTPTPTITPTPTPTPTTDIVVNIPEVPPDEPQPEIPRKVWHLLHIEDYETALGGELLINHVGDCFD